MICVVYTTTGTHVWNMGAFFMNEEKMNTRNTFDLFGRRKIHVTTDVITEENVVSTLNEILPYHFYNVGQIEFLYWYRRGNQPILYKEKEIRPEINNVIMLNTADQVVVFKNGYFLNKPTSYMPRKEDESLIEQVSKLNEYMYLSGKKEAENDVVNWFHTVGIGVMYAEPNDDKDIPVNIYSLDPRSAFVCYSLKPGEKPVMGVNMVIANQRAYFDVFTKDRVFHLSGTATEKILTDSAIEEMAIILDSSEPNYISEIPMAEFFYNENRMSAFETAIPIMDAMNFIESNRMDGVQQTVESLCVATNCEFEEGTTANTIRQAGLISLKSTGDNKADFQILTETLDQTQTQTTINDLYEQILYKCALPLTTKGGTSASDTGISVFLRDGWQQADVAANNTTDLYIKSMRDFDKSVMSILDAKGFSINKNDFELMVERNSTSNLVTKTQAALNMKELGFAPEIVFERAGISSDPLKDIEISKKYIEMKWDSVSEETEETTEETIPFGVEQTPPQEVVDMPVEIGTPIEGELNESGIEV